MGTKGKVRKFFDGIAGSYAATRYGDGADPWRAYFFGGRLEHARDLLQGAGGTVLDLGSGPGVLGDAPAFGDRVIHLDLSSAMLSGAADGVQADARAVPLADESVDVVVALGLTTYLDDLRPLLSEVRRVLRPGGRLLIGITRRAAPDTVLRGLFRNTLGRLGGGRGVLSAGMSIRPWSEGETRRALRSAGFRLRDLRRHNFTVFPLCYILKRLSIRLGKRLEAGQGRFSGLASDTLFLARKGDLPPPSQGTRIRVLRAIARLNVGGPARQTILLTRDLDPDRYDSRLVTGQVADYEGDMAPDAEAAGVSPMLLPGLGRDIYPAADLRALLGMIFVILGFRPHVVHTHTAKAGALGRIAAFLLRVPVRIHTFHGHVLHGYFGKSGSALLRAAELLLARLSTKVIAVSEEVKADLAVRHRIAPTARIDVVPLGLDLGWLTRAERRRGELREELGISADAPIVVTVGRITAIKEPELLISVARKVLGEMPEARFVVVGGGDRFEAAVRMALRLDLAKQILFLGWRSDLDRILADADLALLTSRNEGTPVALIEAAAAGVPAVATEVGGVPSVVEDGVSGLLAPSGDEAALARAVLNLLRDRELRLRMGVAARERVLARFGASRLVDDIDRLYRVSLAAAAGRRAP